MGGCSDLKGNGIAHGNYYKGQPNGKQDGTLNEDFCFTSDKIW